MRICINGFGRIGRAAFRIAQEHAEIEVVRINDLADVATLAYLLKHDSTYGGLTRRVRADDGRLVIDDHSIPVSSERDPASLPHEDDGVDLVLESTGVFRTREAAGKHLNAGARKVLISAPGKDEIDGNFILGVNDHEYDADRHHIVSIGSCTTNCLAPMVKVLHDRFRVRSGLMTTVHAYTASQSLIDAPDKKVRRGRAAAANIVPTTTGAAGMIGKIIPELDGRLDGMALRVPVICGSITDLTCLVEHEVQVDDVNEAFHDYADGRGSGILAVEEDPLVSSDIVGNPHSCTLLPGESRVTGDRLVKVMGWYDNEWGFANRLIDMMKHMQAAESNSSAKSSLSSSASRR